ncbi:MAG: pyridoxal 5'-phosphate synthase, partial [Pseudomonadota bacterium]
LGNLKAAMCFHWKSLQRQVRVRGPISIVDDAEADAYYKSRARGSRIGAWASKQSRPLSSKFELEKEVAKYTARHAVGPIPRPPHWSGFRLTPTYLEFWQDGTFRLHDRIVFEREDAHSGWEKKRLYP